MHIKRCDLIEQRYDIRGHIYAKLCHFFSVFVSRTGSIVLWVSRNIALVALSPSFHLEYLIEFPKLTGVLHFISWFSFISWITVLISMLTSLVCAGVFQLGSYHCLPSAGCQCAVQQGPRLSPSPPRQRSLGCECESAVMPTAPTFAAARAQQQGDLPQRPSPLQVGQPKRVASAGFEGVI